MTQLSLTLGQDLWRELLGAALPIRLAAGNVAIAATARQLIVQTGMPGRVSGLLMDGHAPRPVRFVSDRAAALWRRRKAGVYRRLGALVHVQGSWTVELDALGTDVRYGRQEVSADAWVRGVAEGTVYLLEERVEFPFRLERRVGASVALKDIRYDRGQEAVLGSLSDLAVHIGDGAAMQLLSRLAEAVLGPRLAELNPVPLVTKEGVRSLLGSLVGSLHVELGVEDLELTVGEGEATLRVFLGFSRAQLTDRQAKGA